jgi:hypothetical protein
MSLGLSLGLHKTMSIRILGKQLAKPIWNLAFPLKPAPLISGGLAYSAVTPCLVLVSAHQAIGEESIKP